MELEAGRFSDDMVGGDYGRLRRVGVQMVMEWTEDLWPRED
jgi:hypothetical protein